MVWRRKKEGRNDPLPVDRVAIENNETFLKGGHREEGRERTTESEREDTQIGVLVSVCVVTGGIFYSLKQTRM